MYVYIYIYICYIVSGCTLRARIFTTSLVDIAPPSDDYRFFLIYIYIYIYTHVYAYISIYLSIYLYIYIYIYIYIYTTHHMLLIRHLGDSAPRFLDLA